MRLLRSVALVIALASNAWADSAMLSKFDGLNNSVDPVVIGPTQSQDMLNVEVNKTGTGIKKRDGYVTAINISPTCSGSGITSSFAFKNASGDECWIFSDASGNICKSSNLTAPVKLSTITAGGRLYCQENQGMGYCFTSASERPFTYDCVTWTYKGSDSYPYGRASVFTTDRQVVVSSGTEYPNRAWFSKSGDFDEFDTGSEDYDAWFEDVGNSGDRIIGVYYVNGRVVYGKEYSLLGAVADTQYDYTGYVISDRVGIPNAEAAVVANDGYLYLKGTDNEFYRTNGAPSNIENISNEISSTTAQLLNGKSRYNLQTEYADWAAGTPGLISYSQTVGSIEPSSFTAIDQSKVDFGSGTFSTRITTRTVGSNITLSSQSYIVHNGDFETGTCSGSTPLYWTLATGGSAFSRLSASGAISGSCGLQNYVSASGGNIQAYVNILDETGGVTLYSRTYTDSTEILSGSSINLYSLGLSTRTLKIQFKAYDATGGAEATATSSTFTAISSISWSGASVAGAFGWGKLDDIRTDRNFSVYQDSAAYLFTSRVFDTGMVTPISGAITSTFTAGGANTLAFATRQSSDNSTWGAWVPVVFNQNPNMNKRYWQYQSSFTVYSGTDTAPSVTSISIVAVSTGQYVTQCIQPGTWISAWGVTQTAGSNSCGLVSYEASTGTACGSMQAYVAFSTGSIPSVDTATALTYRLTFSVNSATCTARVDSITTNWTQGNAPPPVVSAYWKDAIYWGVATAGTQNNRVLKLDLLNRGWYPFDMPARSMMTWNNGMYFGSTTTAKLYKFSDPREGYAPSSDDGTAIDSYWTSKNIGFNDPFQELTLDRISLIARKESGGTLTAAYYMNGGDTGTNTWTVGLSTGTNVVRSNYSVPFGSRGSFFNLKISNNSTQPWEVLGIKFDFTSKGWRPLP